MKLKVCVKEEMRFPGGAREEGGGTMTTGTAPWSRPRVCPGAAWRWSSDRSGGSGGRGPRGWRGSVCCLQRRAGHWGAHPRQPGERSTLCHQTRRSLERTSTGNIRRGGKSPLENLNYYPWMESKICPLMKKMTPWEVSEDVFWLKIIHKLFRSWGPA